VKRIIVIIVLSICLLGTAGWGISTRHEVSLLENNIRELSNTIAQQARTITGQETTIADQKARIAVQENIITDQISTITIQLGTIKALGDSNRQKDLMIEGLTFSLGKDMLVVPRDSPGFDCDDSALYMYEYFTSLHYTVRIVKGNLDMTGETLAQCNHVWVWVTAPTGGEIAYDWGKVFTDEQHRVGYVISYKDLLMAALSDY
jgi:hypothetical protein